MNGEGLVASRVRAPALKARDGDGRSGASHFSSSSPPLGAPRRGRAREASGGPRSQPGPSGAILKGEIMDEAKPMRQSQVSEQCERLFRAVDKLEIALGSLVERLAPVLMPPPPIESPDLETDQELVPVANSLRTQIQRIEAIAEALGALENRVEV